MAKEHLNPILSDAHGKTSKNDPGYHYVDAFGTQRYRVRLENYQQNQSPRQKWNSAAFAYAHRQMNLLKASPSLLDQLQSDFLAADRTDSSGRTYTDPLKWKFNMLLHSWKQEHPFDTFAPESPITTKPRIDVTALVASQSPVASTRHCPSCNAEVNAGDNFCHHCGHKL